DENVIREVMLAYHRLSDRPNALRTFESFVARLATDLELSPSSDVVALAEEIRRAPPASSGCRDDFDASSAIGRNTPARTRAWMRARLPAAAIVVIAAAAAWRGATHGDEVR